VGTQSGPALEGFLIIKKKKKLITHKGRNHSTHGVYKRAPNMKKKNKNSKEKSAKLETSKL
jgi:hypothetical protein